MHRIDAKRILFSSYRNLRRKVMAARRNVAVFLMIFVLMFGQISPFVSVAYAATSPWTETDWSTGNYDSVSSVTTSTSGQTTLTNTEKLSNTGFETNLTGWDTTTEAYDSELAAAVGAVVAWPMDDTTTTQSYTRVVNPAIATGRDIVLNGGFDSDTLWTKGTGVTITGGVLRYTAVTNGVNTSQIVPVSIGKVYEITYTVSNLTSGTVQVRFSSSQGTIRSADGTYTEEILATSTSLLVIAIGSSSTFDVDNVIVKQVDIPAYNGSFSQILSDGDMETSGTGSWSAGNAATLSKQTDTPHGGSQVLRVARSSVNNPGANQAALTVGESYRIYGYARSDGSATPSILDNGGTTMFTGTTSTSWQPFDAVFVAKGATLVLRATTSTDAQYVEFDDVVVSLNTGIRQGELSQDGDMETSGTGYWVSAQSGSLSKQTTDPHGGSQVLRVAYNGVSSPGAAQAILVNGKRYRITGYYRGDGTFAPRVLYGGTVGVTGTSSTTWQSFDITVIPSGGANLELRSLATSSGYAEFDDITVTELDPLVGLPSSGVTIGSDSGGHLTKAYTFDSSTDLVNIYSTDLNSAFSPNEGTMIVWAKPNSSSIWSDSATRYIVRLALDANNQIVLSKNSSNALAANYNAGGTTKVTSHTTSTTDWFQVVITWSKTDDQAIMYFNGNQVGSTLTGLGTWSGSLASTNVTIGNASTSGGAPWLGMINDVRLYDEALTSSQILALYTGSTTTRDTSTTYNSTTGSAKIVGASDQITNFTQSINVGDTNSYNLSAYAYTSGAAVTSSDVQLFYNGSTVSTTYTSVGGGWYQLTGTVTGANESRTYGVQVKAGKTVYLDNISVNNYASSGSLTSNIFDSGQGSNWGTLTYNATTPTNTTVVVKARTSNSSTMSGADDFSSCSAITSGSDISSNSCVTDADRYIQYQVSLSSSDLLNSPTFQDISITFETSDDVGPSFELDSPGNNSYTNNERPTFKWKAATDVSSSVSDYNLIIDNPSLGVGNPSGDFVISDIPVSRTEDYVTNKYVVHYEGFSDSDATNNYISVYTKSSSEWSSDSNSGENDGKLREGKIVWSVESTDSAGNKTSSGRTLFVDKTNPNVSFTQVNDVQISNSLSTTDRTPTLYGKIVDPLAGGDSSVTQTVDGPRVASGPKQVEIKIEKKQGLVYILHTSYVINIDKSKYTCDDTVVSDNSKQKCDKYLPFEYTQKDNLDLGTYKVSVTGKDNADNTSSTTSFNLNVTTYSQITTTEEKEIIEEEISTLPTEQQEEVKETLEITKPTEPSEPSIVSKAGESAMEAGGNLLSSIGDMLTNLGGGIVYVFKSVTTTIAWIGSGTWNALTTLASGIGDGLIAAAKFIGNATYVIAQAVGNTLIAAANMIGSGYNWIAQGAPGVLRGVLLAFGDAVAGAGRAIGWIGTNTGKTIAQITANIGTAIGDTTRVIGDGLRTLTANTGKAVGSTLSNIGNGIGFIAVSTTDGVRRTQAAITNGMTTIAFSVGEKTQNISGSIGLAIIKFTYNFVPEPTTISDVKVAKATPTTMTITWTTNHPATSKVNYGLTPDYGQDVQFTKRVTHHEVTITGLEPNTTYSYEVMSQNKNYVYDANHMFTTPRE